MPSYQVADVYLALTSTVPHFVRHSMEALDREGKGHFAALDVAGPDHVEGPLPRVGQLPVAGLRVQGFSV